MASNADSDPSVVTDRTDTDFEPPDDTSGAHPILGTIMVLWFLAGGIVGVFFMVPNFLSTRPYASITSLAVIGASIVPFILAGVAAKMITWSAPTVPESTPWELRPAWQSPTIEEDLYFRSVPPWFAAMFAVAGWAVGGIGLYFNYWLPEDPASSNLFLLVFPLAFSIPAVSTLRRAWHRQAHGTSALTMDTMPGRLGQTLDGRVQAGVDPSAMKSDTFRVALTCYHRSKSGDNTSWRVLWEAETEAQGRTGVGTNTEPSADVEIPVSFDLPADAPHSTPEKKRDRIAWILEVSADTGGLDYQSYFEIPVFEPEGSPATAPEKSSPPTGSESSRPESTDKPDRPSPDEPSPSREPAAPDASSSQEPAPSGLNPEAVPDEAFSDDTDSDDTDRHGDETEERFSDDPFSGNTGDEDTVQCDNCYSTVDASASTCPACGADLGGGSGWFS